jgi:hypothetical protein
LRVIMCAGTEVRSMGNRHVSPQPHLS